MNEEELRAAHRELMKAWGLNLSPAHEEKVVAWTLKALSGDPDRPQGHDHETNETGACVECDAATLLVLAEDEEADDE